MGDDVRTLRIDFDGEAAFRGEYLSNISNGGVFVATNAGFDVRDAVRVELGLQWCGESIALDGEVVHVVTPEMGGDAAGVAVQFALRASDLRERFAPVLERIKAEDAEHGGPGSRIARRSRVRVPIWVITTDGVEREGRSRDVSTTGALIGIERGPYEDGEIVELVIVNPVSAAEIEVHGTVMRCVPEPSGRCSIGVRFEIPPSEVDEVGSFVRELQISEESRRLGGISGPIGEIGIQALLRTFGTCAPHGTLTLTSGEQEAIVAYEAGMICGAQLADVRGADALARILSWRAGTFEFVARPSSALRSGQPIAVDAALIDAVERQGAVPRESSVQFAPEAKLRVDRDKMRASEALLSQGEEAILDLAAVGMSVGKVVEVIPEPYEAICEQLQGLVERGLIHVVG